MERLFLNLKMERVWQRDCANHAEATGDIVDYIVSFDNCAGLISTDTSIGGIHLDGKHDQEATKDV